MAKQAGNLTLDTMESNDDIRRLLEEIRDTQREHLAEYREAARRSVALQEDGLERQRSVIALYKRWMAVGAVVLVPLTGFVFYLIWRYL